MNISPTRNEPGKEDYVVILSLNERAVKKKMANQIDSPSFS